MNHLFFQAVCRVGIFTICAQAIVHFRPQEAYEKYLKLLVSVMILIQLVLPIGSFFPGGRMDGTAQSLEAFRVALEREMNLAAEEALLVDETLERMTLEEVARRLEEQEKQQSEAVEPIVIQIGQE